MRRAIAMGAALVLCTCGRRAVVWEPVDLKKAHASDFGEATSATLFAQKTVRFGVDEKTGRAYADVETHERQLALKPGALQQHVSGTFDRTFNPGPPTIDGRVIYPSGDEEPLDLDRAWEHPLWEAGILYNDTRVLSVPVPVLPKGGVLEYRVKTRIIDLKPFQFRYALGGAEPAVLDRFQVIAPKGWKLEWVVRRMGEAIDLPPKLEQTATEQSWTWEVRDAPAHPREVNGIDPRSEVPLVVARLSEWQSEGKTERAFQSPRELSAWLYEKIQAASQPDDAMRATVKQLLAGAPDDPREKARRLYTHVCTRVQYCAIEVGYGGWFPHSAAKVQETGYGDCKDKANYLKGLLDVAGIKSRPTLIYYHQGMPLPFELPSLAANFNHEILTIDLPEGPLLADPTSRTVAFGDLPVGDREATVLPIQEGGADLSVSPVAVPEDHVEVERFALAVGADGTGRGTFEVEATGALAASLRGQLIVAVPSRQSEVMSSWLDLAEAKVTEVSEIKGLELVPMLGVKGGLKAPRLLLGETDSRMLRLSALVPRWLPGFDDAGRRTPLVLQNRYKKVGEVKLTLPAQLSVKRAPAPFTRSSKWVDYKLTYETKGSELVARRELVQKERIIRPEELSAYRQVAEAITLAENAAVLLGAAQ